jgi:biopolymer transport protein ExbD
MKVTVKRKAITEGALIAMTDVIFLLLLFMLITSNFVTYTGIDIKVPTSQNAHSEIQKNLSVTINARDEITVNGKLVTRENLVEVLRVEIEENPDITVMISADQNIALQKVIEIIDSAKEAGSTRFFIAAEHANRRN